MPVPPLPAPNFHDIVSRASYGIINARDSISGQHTEPSALQGREDIASVAHMVQGALKLPAPAPALEQATKALDSLNKAYDTLAPFAAQDPDWPSQAGIQATNAALSLADQQLFQAARASA